MKNEQNQQGDVLLKRVKSIKKNTKKIENKNNMVTLALGEHTGNHHSIYSDDSNVCLLEDEDGVQYVENKNEYDVELKHQEHNVVKVSPGIHQIGIVREYDYFKDMVNPVRD